MYTNVCGLGKTINSSLNDSHQIIMLNCDPNKTVVSNALIILGSGQQYGFQLVLNSNLNGRPNNEPGNRRATEFKVALSNIYGPFDVRTDPVFIKAGTSTRVRVTPGFTTAAAGIQEGLSIADRKCRFRDENEKMKIFADYTRVISLSIFKQ